MVKLTKTEANLNRQRVIDTAARLFRDKGFDAVSISDLMAAAGFTHGGFYNHFESKEHLAAEALKFAFEEMEQMRARSATVNALISSYLSELHRQSRGQGCPVAALGADAARQPNQIKREFETGVEGMIRSFETLLAASGTHSTSRSVAISLVCTMVGALSIARAIPDDSALGGEILSTAKRACGAAVLSKS